MQSDDDNLMRLDCDTSGGTINLFVRVDIPEKLLTSEKVPGEGFYVELNSRNEKWLINCSYNLGKTFID